MQGWMKYKLESRFQEKYQYPQITSDTKIARKNINNLRYADATTFIAETKEDLRSLLMKVSEIGEWKNMA